MRPRRFIRNRPFALSTEIPRPDSPETIGDAGSSSAAEAGGAISTSQHGTIEHLRGRRLLARFMPVLRNTWNAHAAAHYSKMSFMCHEIPWHVPRPRVGSSVHRGCVFRTRPGAGMVHPDRDPASGFDSLEQAAVARELSEDRRPSVDHRFDPHP